MTDLFPQGHPTGDMNGSNEYEGFSSEQAYVDGFDNGHDFKLPSPARDTGPTKADRYARQIKIPY